MTATTTNAAEHAGFCRAIRTGCETSRGAYADWLCDRPTVRECPECKGECRMNYWQGVGLGKYDLDPCRTCSGEGTVTDTSDRDHGELIRVQCELANMPKRVIAGVECDAVVAKKCRWCLGEGCSKCRGAGDASLDCPAIPLRSRESELTAALTHRLPPCPGGYGTREGVVLHSTRGVRCGVCNGTNRVGKWVHRGLLSVPVPSLSSLWERWTEETRTVTMGRYQRTFWAERLRAEYPWVESVPVLDRQPLTDSRWGRAGWHTRPGDGLSHHLPEFLFDAMRGGGEEAVDGNRWRWFSTSEAAQDALARAVALTIFDEHSIPPAAEPG